MPPVFQTSIFDFPDVAALRAGIAREMDTPFYTRGNNPTVMLLARKIAALEGAEAGLMFASGSGAIAAAVLAHVGQGDEVVAAERPYSWTGHLLRSFLPRFGVRTTFVGGGSGAGFAEALGSRTRMIVLESPNSLTFGRQDLAAIAAVARKRGILTLCDNSYATPLRQRPITQGIDLVAHSASKYLGGHSDVVAGALCGSAAAMERVFNGPYMTLGAVLGPFEAWLVLRGLRTLPVRLERVSATARELVQALRGHPRIAAVHYPEDLGTGLFSITLRVDSVAQVEVFCNALRRFRLACSWGGYEALAYPMCALSESVNYAGTGWPPWDLVRLSVGLEDADLLREDLLQALSALDGGHTSQR